MATKLIRAPHIPRLARTGAFKVRVSRAGEAAGRPFPSGLPGSWAPAVSAPALPLRVFRGWRRRALREGVVVSLLTSLLTSAVLAAPEAFQQAPAVTWRQLLTPAVVADQPAEGGTLLDCP